MSLPVANFSNIINSIIANSPEEDKQILIKGNCLFPTIKSPWSLDEQFRLNGEIYRNLLVGTVSVIDGRLVISTFDVWDIDFEITNVDDVVNHATFRLFRRFEVPTYTLFGFNSQEKFDEVCKILKMIGLSMDNLYTIMSYLKLGKNKDFMLVPICYSKFEGPIDSPEINVDVHQLERRPRRRIRGDYPDRIARRIEEEIEYDINTNIVRDIEMKEYNKITDSGSYLGTFDDFALYNVRNSCGFKIDNFEPLVTTRIPVRNREVAMVDDVLVNEFLYG
tara:strand:+ start:233 stop:1066 length:834 start_codon:yes stop_codon:yes gene_type:complete